MDLQGAEGVTIYIPVSSDNQTAYHVDQYGRFVQMSGVIVTIDGAKYISFDADSFSFYFVEEIKSSSSSSNMIFIIVAIVIIVIAVLLVAYYFMHKKKTST